MSVEVFADPQMISLSEARSEDYMRSLPFKLDCLTLTTCALDVNNLANGFVPNNGESGYQQQYNPSLTYQGVSPAYNKTAKPYE